MIRRPPRSTLFPTRRSSDLSALVGGIRALRDEALPAPSAGLLVEGLARPVPVRRQPKRAARLEERLRSEEHTSELQSQSNLVCRLLLEKKNEYTTQFDAHRL